jgi:hypothetical protein
MAHAQPHPWDVILRGLQSSKDLTSAWTATGDFGTILSTASQRAGSRKILHGMNPVQDDIS